MTSTAVKYGFDSRKSQKFPSIVQLSITNVCDMSCLQCPHSTYVKQEDYSPSYLDIELFKKIADEIGKNKGSLRILGWGEALTHKQLAEMVSYGKKAGIRYINLITNGLKLNEETSRELIKAKLDVLEVSLDAYKKETYEATRNNPFFEKIESNIFNFLKLRTSLSGSTYVAVGIIDQPKALAEINDFKTFWMQHVEDVIVRKYRDFKKHNENIIPPHKRHPCRCLWARFNINSEGKISVCYDDWKNQNIVGDLNKEGASIEKIWQSKMFADYRKAHLAGKPFGICAKCNDWIASSWDKPYELVFEKVKKWRDEGHTEK